MRKMKDSGIEWIGEIPENWKTVSLNKIANIQTGSTPTKTNQEQFYSDEFGIPWIKAEDLGTGFSIEKTSEYLTPDGCDNGRLFPPNTVYVCCIASVGKVGYSCVESSCNQQINALVFNNNYYWKYGYYVSLSQETEYINNASGNVMKIINSDKQSRLKCPLPPLPEQPKIAAYLDTQCAHIDSVIEKTKQSIEEYKKLKQAVITQAVTKGVRGKREMKDSGIEYLGLMPIEWNIISISKAFTFSGGYAYKSDRFCNETSNQVIRIGNVKNDSLLLDSKAVYIDDDYAEESKASVILQDDILFTMTGTKGKKDYFYTVKINSSHLNSKRLFLNQRVGCFRKKANIDMNYYCYLLKYERLKDYIFLYETGTANQGNLGIETINRTKMYLPPLEEQQEIAAYLDKKCAEIDTLITKKEQFLTELESYKKSMIYEYVTGKKEVL